MVSKLNSSCVIRFCCIFCCNCINASLSAGSIDLKSIDCIFMGKNNPTEQSSKRPVSFKRSVVSVEKTKFRDPRFEPLSGNFNAELFKRSYGFISEIQQQELQDLRKSKTDLELLNCLESKMKASKQKEDEQALVRQWKKTEAEKVKQGKKPYYLKKCFSI
jgi:ribosomal RNA-processing protein 36